MYNHQAQWHRGEHPFDAEGFVMKSPWLSAVLGLISFVGMCYWPGISENDYYTLSSAAQHHVWVVTTWAGLLGLVVSGLAIALGAWRLSRPVSLKWPSYVGIVLGSLSAFFLFVGLIFPPYEF